MSEVAPSPAVDLTNCDREPIQIPSCIQPHGMLAVLEDPSLRILQVSANAGSFCGVEVEALLGGGLDMVLRPPELACVRSAVARRSLDGSPLYLFTGRLVARDEPVDGIAHRHDGLLLLELEPAVAGAEHASLRFQSLIKLSVTNLARPRTLAALAQAICHEVREVTGFDRVCVYRFAEDFHGEVIAEEIAEGMTPWRGLHYPASDIPAQARALYTQNPLRLIADADYRPTPIVPALNPITGRPLDLSYSVLRSVSPIHLEYLHNLGTASSMSVSVLKNGKLWGLVSCHHRTPRFVPCDLRTASELLGQFVSLRLPTTDELEDAENKLRLREDQGRLAERFALSSSIAEGLLDGEPNIGFIASDGQALFVDRVLRRRGVTPSDAAILELLRWLREEVPDDVFATDCLSRDHASATSFCDVGSGLLAACISRTRGDYALWFRSEQVRTVRWAGDPHKPVEPTPEGLRLSPRQSFELWKETVRSRSRPWRPWEVEAARALRQSILTMIARQAEELQHLQTEELRHLNKQLARANDELNTFAFVASHDLKEPLRGLSNYAQFLVEDHSAQLDDEGKEKLATLRRLTRRMEALLDSLLDYSRVGRTELRRQDLDLDSVLDQVLEILDARLRETATTVRRPGKLGRAHADGQRVQELLTNLISNAAKYNDKAERWIEVGREDRPGEPAIFHVRDNGIGIAAEDVPRVFEIFRRLHPRDAYGGGTGVGLTIARRIVEHHEGKLWIDSTPGEGTGVYFTLEASAS
jgi:light-regulated signal transduction histidine kinase (bacteriophytochrome)